MTKRGDFALAKIYFHIGRLSWRDLSKFSSSNRDPKEDDGRSGDVQL